MQVLVIGDMFGPIDGSPVDAVLNSDVGHGGGVGGGRAAAIHCMRGAMHIRGQTYCAAVSSGGRSGMGRRRYWAMAV